MNTTRKRLGILQFACKMHVSSITIRLSTCVLELEATSAHRNLADRTALLQSASRLHEAASLTLYFQSCSPLLRTVAVRLTKMMRAVVQTMLTAKFLHAPLPVRYNVAESASKQICQALHVQRICLSTLRNYVHICSQKHTTALKQKISLKASRNHCLSSIVHLHELRLRGRNIVNRTNTITIGG